MRAELAAGALILLLTAGACDAQSGSGALGIGSPATPGQLAGAFAVAPDGTGLPPGHGTVAEGAAVYAQACAGCHGGALTGQKASGVPALVGGRSSLAGPAPLKTVESYWPYATTLFDYIERAMPMNAPGSLSPNQVYALAAFILDKGGIAVPPSGLDARTLPEVRMPNRNGFVPDRRPEPQLYR